MVEEDILNIKVLLKYYLLVTNLAARACYKDKAISSHTFFISAFIREL